MVSKHTNGPWTVEATPYDSTAFYIRGTKTNGKPMTFGLGAVAHIPRSTVLPSEANAKLIAMAPAMLEVLLQIVGPFEAAKACGMPFGEATIKSDSQMLKKIRAVIAKAEGRS